MSTLKLVARHAVARITYARGPLGGRGLLRREEAG